MAKLTLAQIEYLSQQLTSQFKDFKSLTFKAWLELELALETLKNLLKTYDQWLAEEGLDHEQQ